MPSQQVLEATISSKTLAHLRRDIETLLNCVEHQSFLKLGELTSRYQKCKQLICIVQVLSIACLRSLKTINSFKMTEWIWNSWSRASSRIYLKTCFHKILIRDQHLENLKEICSSIWINLELSTPCKMVFNGLKTLNNLKRLKLNTRCLLCSNKQISEEPRSCQQ